MKKDVSMVTEDSSGRNKTFRDHRDNRILGVKKFVREIEKGFYPHHHIRVINGVKTPVSNPDKSKTNNLE